MNINIYPVLANWKQSKKDGRCPIHLSVDVNNKRIAFPSIKRKILPKEWDEQSKRVKLQVTNADLINATIKKEISRLDKEFLQKDLLGIKLSKNSIKTVVKGNSGGVSFTDFCLEQIKLSRYSPNTTRVLTHEVSKLKKFGDNIHFEDLNYDFFQRYEQYMKDVLENQTNTIWKSFKFVNAMLNRAIKVGGIISDNPLSKYERIKYRQCIPPYLEWAEVTKIKEQLQTNSSIGLRTRMVGYYFLLSCTSGLRFSDTVRFIYDKFVIEDENGKRLLLSTAKTGEIVSISFTKQIAEVIEIIKSVPIRITNQEFNRELKILTAIVGLSKPLKSHMGRHTFAMRCAEIGMSEEDVQRLLGHSKRETTKVYFRIKNKRLDDAMKLWDK